MEGAQVYIVSDCGQNWPAAGLIFGVYDSEEAANQRYQELKMVLPLIGKGQTLKISELEHSLSISQRVPS